jgi:hypothetical protein
MAICHLITCRFCVKEKQFQFPLASAKLTGDYINNIGKA